VSHTLLAKRRRSTLQRTMSVHWRPACDSAGNRCGRSVDVQLGLRDLPNLITLARMVSVVPLAWLLLKERYDAALVLAFVAGASDGVDGWLAKKFDWVSRAGSLLDPLADKLMLGVGMVVLTLQGHLPLWLLAIVLGRDLVIIGGATFYNYMVKPLAGEPSLISKLNTVLQIALLLLLLVQLALQANFSLGLEWLIWAVAATSIVSGAHYIWLGVVRTRQHLGVEHDEHD